MTPEQMAEQGYYEQAESEARQAEQEANELMRDAVAYFAFKRVAAVPMTRQAYNELRGWTVPADEDPADEGFLVEDLDQRSNVAGFRGYVSWSPKDVFERAYRPSGKMSYGMALEAMKHGECVARAGWNGKGMYVFYEPDVLISVRNQPQPSDPVIVMWTAQGTFQAGWLVSQPDNLSNDWMIVG